MIDWIDVTRLHAHKICYLNDPFLVNLHYWSDTAIFVAYFLIPFLLGYVLLKYGKIPYWKILVLFALFIVFCGYGHKFDADEIESPATFYWSGFWNIGTAFFSFAAAYYLYRITDDIMLTLKAYGMLVSPERVKKLKQELREKQKVKKWFTE